MTPPGTVLAERYRLTTLVLDTGVSELWSATDEVDRAVRFVEVYRTRTPDEIEAFTRNAAVLASISRAFTYAISAAGTGPGVGYLTLAGGEGRSMHDWLRHEAPLRQSTAAWYIVAIADALLAAHGAGIVHGGLGTQTIVVKVGTIQLVGFDLTGTRAAATAADDVQALGAIAVELLGGTPSDGATLAPDTDPALVALVRGALAPAEDRVGLADLRRQAQDVFWRLDTPLFRRPGQVPTQSQDEDERADHGSDQDRYGGWIEQELPPAPQPPPAVEAWPDLGALPPPAPPAPAPMAPPAPAQQPAPVQQPAPFIPPPASAQPAPAMPSAPGAVPAPRERAAVPSPKPAQDRRARPESGSPKAVRLEFAAAYREAIEVAKPYPMLFFVHGPDDWARVQSIIDRRREVIGTPAVSRGVASKDVGTGTILTIVPTVLGATFEPASIEVVAGDDLRELTFQLTATQAGTIDGYIDIFVGPLIIGQVPVAFRVHEAAVASVPTQPGAQLMHVANASIFDTIFISYSHKDTDVVDLCVATYQGLGVRVLVDKHELRSGEDWRAALQRLIEDSNIFQLYWSAAASVSQEVEHEWRLALGLAKTRQRFIRPLYWETPLPPAPEPLGSLHFSKVDLKALRRAAKAYLPKPGLLRRIFGR